MHQWPNTTQPLFPLVLCKNANFRYRHAVKKTHPDETMVSWCCQITKRGTEVSLRQCDYKYPSSTEKKYKLTTIMVSLYVSIALEMPYPNLIVLSTTFFSFPSRNSLNQCPVVIESPWVPDVDIHRWLYLPLGFPPMHCSTPQMCPLN